MISLDLNSHISHYWMNCLGYDVMLLIPAKSHHSYALNEHQNDKYAFAGEGKVKISIGDSISIKGKGAWRYRNMNLRPIFVENTGTDTLILGTEDRLLIEVEKWEHKGWKRTFRSVIDEGDFLFCLPPGKMLVALEKFDADGIPCRLRIGTNFSKAFQ